MKRKLQRRNRIRWIIPVVAMLMVSPTIYGAPAPVASKAPQKVSGSSGKKSEAVEAAKKAKSHARLTAEYGLTQQQLQQFDQLNKEIDAAKKAVNKDSALSKQERSKRIKAIGKDLETRMAAVMDKQQYDKWLKNRKERHQQDQSNKKELGKQISQIRKSNIPHLQQREQIAAAKAQFVEKSAAISGNQKNAEHKLRKRNGGTVMAKQDKENVDLSFNRSKKLKALKKEKNSKIAELKAQNLTKRSYEAEYDKIMTPYRESVKKLTGDPKFVQWDKNRKASYNKRLKERFDMTPEQITKYKDLQNARAIEIFKVSHSKLPKADRKTKKNEIGAKYDAKIKEILTADQSSKMFTDKAYKKQKNAKVRKAKAAPLAKISSNK